MGRVTSTCDQEYRTVGSNFLHLCQFLVCSGKSQLSNYVNAHCLQISIWTWLMSYHVETALCHEITTCDILWQPYLVPIPVYRYNPVSNYTIYALQWDLHNIFLSVFTISMRTLEEMQTVKGCCKPKASKAVQSWKTLVLTVGGWALQYRYTINFTLAQQLTLAVTHMAAGIITCSWSSVFTVKEAAAVWLPGNPFSWLGSVSNQGKTGQRSLLLPLHTKVRSGTHICAWQFTYF